MSTKIAIVTPTFPPYRGGIGKVAEADARDLAAAGYETVVFTPTVGAAREAEGFSVREIQPWFRVGNAACAPELRKLSGEFALVLLHYPFFGGAEFAALGRRLSAHGKLAIVYHMDVVGQGLRGLIFGAHTRWVQPFILRSADRLIVTTFDYLRESRLAGYFAGHESRFRELAPPVDVGRFAPGPKPSALLARYGLDPADRVILFVGGLDQAHYFKGVPNLLQALVSDGLKTAHAVIVGDGDLRPGLEALAASLDLTDRVAFAGSVKEEELPDHYRLADIFAFPSIDRSEAYGIAALEALSTGVPVVASDLPGVRTIVRHGETGYCVPPGSVSGLAARLADLLGDDVARQRLGQTAREMAVNEYSAAIRRRRLLQMVQELAGPPVSV
ncbi:MAG: glycosyltransferase family 4 protein [Patescibacteria group bacterium]|jgi:glycosyltransferase involved in cell wall biosynthesis